MGLRDETVQPLRAKRRSSVARIVDHVSLSQSCSALRVEQMCLAQIRHQCDALPRMTVDAVAKHRHHFLARDAAEHLRICTRRLDNDDVARHAGVTFGQREMFGTDSVQHLLAVGSARVGRSSDANSALKFHHRSAAGARAIRLTMFDCARQEVHRRRSDEARDERVRRAIVELERRADLLDDAIAQDHDLVGHRHRFDLVMRDVDRSGAQSLVKLLDLGAHLHAQLGVEIGQRLIEQEDLRIADNRAAHRDALALTAGQLSGIAIEIRDETENVAGLLNALLDLGLRALGEHQRERHVVADGHVRIERVVLEHHRDVALFRRAVLYFTFMFNSIYFLYQQK